jgi:hypothetical protein
METDASPESTKPHSIPNLRWIDELERDFDKTFVEMDILLGDVDADQADLMTDCRQKMTSISSCFAQLICKAQILSQKNSKLEVRAY